MKLFAARAGRGGARADDVHGRPRLDRLRSAVRERVRRGGGRLASRVASRGQCPSGQWLVARGGDACVDEDSPRGHGRARRRGRRRGPPSTTASTATARPPTRRARRRRSRRPRDDGRARGRRGRRDGRGRQGRRRAVRARSVLARGSRAARSCSSRPFVVVAGVPPARRSPPRARRRSLRGGATKGLLAAPRSAPSRSARRSTPPRASRTWRRCEEPATRA